MIIRAVIITRIENYNNCSFATVVSAIVIHCFVSLEIISSHLQLAVFPVKPLWFVELYRFGLFILGCEPVSENAAVVLFFCIHTFVKLVVLFVPLVHFLLFVHGLLLGLLHCLHQLKLLLLEFFHLPQLPDLVGLFSLFQLLHLLLHFLFVHLWLKLLLNLFLCLHVLAEVVLVCYLFGPDQVLFRRVLLCFTSDLVEVIQHFLLFLVVA